VTGEVPFYLVYGRDAKLPSTINFCQPVVKYPVVASDFAKELMEELRYARAITRKNMKKGQAEQKKNYDHRARDSELQVGNLVMLKILPHCRL